MAKQDINYILKRGVAEIIVEEELVQLLRSGQESCASSSVSIPAPLILLSVIRLSLESCVNFRSWVIRSS